MVIHGHNVISNTFRQDELPEGNMRFFGSNTEEGSALFLDSSNTQDIPHRRDGESKQPDYVAEEGLTGSLSSTQVNSFDGEFPHV